MDKATMRAEHPDIAAVVDEIRARGGGVDGIRIGDEVFGRFDTSIGDGDWIELGDHHVEAMRRVEERFKRRGRERG